MEDAATGRYSLENSNSGITNTSPHPKIVALVLYIANYVFYLLFAYVRLI